MRANTERRLRAAVAHREGSTDGVVYGPGSDMLAIRCFYCDLLGYMTWEDAPKFVMRSLSGMLEPAHLDHLIPESKNGPTSLDNTVIACATCNIAKGDSAPGDPGFQTWLRGRRRQVQTVAA